MMELRSVQTQVYEELKNNIMSLRLPPGQTMSTKEMATRMTVSRTPVREAFLRLQSEGLVEMIPQRETRVSKISMDCVAQEKFIRECLELGVISKFLNKKQTEDIRRLKEMVVLQKRCIRNQDPAAFVDADDRFHQVFFDVAGENMAWDTIEKTHGHYNRYRILMVKRTKIIESSILQHEKIIALLEKNDDEAVRNEMLAHIQRIDIWEVRLSEEYPYYFKDSEGMERDGVIKAL